MGMTSLNISLPGSLKTFVEAQIAEGGYSTASEYIRGLIREAQRKQVEEKIESLLLDGLKGEGIQLTKEWWRQFRAKLKGRQPKPGKSPQK
jgi:antitoxin ParD1/3/4